MQGFGNVDNGMCKRVTSPLKLVYLARTMLLAYSNCSNRIYTTINFTMCRWR